MKLVHDDDDNDDDVGDDGDGDNVADDDRAMLDDMDCAAPKMNTSLVAVSGIVGAVGGAKENAERKLCVRLSGSGIMGQTHFSVGPCSAKVLLVLSATALGRKVRRYRSRDVLTSKVTPASFPVMLQ